MGKMKRAISAHGSRWSPHQKLEAVVTYMKLGNMAEVSRKLEIPLDTLKTWKKMKWFNDLCAQVREEQYLETDARISTIVDKTMRALEDRVDHGNHIFDPRTGKLIRVPLSARDVLKATTELMTKQEDIRSKPEKLEVEKTIDARLSKLAEEFMKFAQVKNNKQQATLQPLGETIEGELIPTPQEDSYNAQAPQIPSQDKALGTQEAVHP